ncbi:MAG TPA: hypothetical protein VF681_06875 [Abditibacteriaceae bacterium]|jgi:hypothetical protein
MNNTRNENMTRLSPGDSSVFSLESNDMTIAMSPDLRSFLRDVANSPLKVRILQLFLTQSGVCISSVQLAERIGSDSAEVRVALQELNHEGALMFCPHFGHSDLCLMNGRYQTDGMKRNLQLLLGALREKPESVWMHLKNIDS